jgi:hypothetical protein
LSTWFSFAVFLVFAHILREIALFLDICGADVMFHLDMKATPSVMHNVVASCTPTQFLHEYVHRDWGQHPSGDYTTDAGGCHPSGDHISDAGGIIHLAIILTSLGDVVPLVIISVTLGVSSLW